MKIYIIGPADGPYKVGIAADVASRLSALQCATYQRLYIHGVADATSRREAERIEAAIHSKLDDAHLSGEWFGCSLERVAAAFPKAVEFVSDTEAERKNAYEVLYNLAAGVPPELRQALADHVGAKSNAPSDIAQARLDAIMPRLTVE